MLGIVFFNARLVLPTDLWLWWLAARLLPPAWWSREAIVLSIPVSLTLVVAFLVPI
jgi:hypothetical protein